MAKKDKKSGGLLTALIVGGAIGTVSSMLLRDKQSRKKSYNILKKVKNVGVFLLSKGFSLAQEETKKFIVNRQKIREKEKEK